MPIYTAEEQEYYDQKKILEEEEKKRMACGTCDACKSVGVRLCAYGIWDICDKCLPKTKGKKVCQRNI
jgi:ribosomal protein L37AE/L43A